MDLTPLGLRTLPFTRELPVAERYTYPPQEDAVEGLVGAAHKRMSAALIAPAGTGKTVVLRTVRDKLPAARYRVRYVKVTELSKRDLCREVAAVCGLAPAGIYPARVRKLQDAFCSEYATDGLRPVLLIDEAHDLRVSSLAMLRLITNFEMDSRLVLSVILAGQPPLRQMLARTEAHALAQRLVHVATLRFLSREEVHAYVQHRCRVAGATTDIFDAEAHEALFEISSGNLRAVDHLAIKAIESCARRGVGAVSAKEIVEARSSLCL